MTLPGGDEVCYGYHVWGGRYGDECRRCGAISGEPTGAELEARADAEHERREHALREDG